MSLRTNDVKRPHKVEGMKAAAKPAATSTIVCLGQAQPAHVLLTPREPHNPVYSGSYS
jgi:hypothetical protein